MVSVGFTVFVALLALLAGMRVGGWLCDTHEEKYPQAKMCTREGDYLGLPHICRVNGPCNGLPREPYEPYC